MFKKVLIIGCGLIGSSILRAIHSKKLSKKILVLEKNEKLFADYSLEISSPGIERPLTREKDFKIWSNNFVHIKLNSDKDFPKKFNAKLLGFSKNKIKIFIENENDLNGEYNLDPLMIKEVILSWVEKDPPKPNLIS